MIMQQNYFISFFTKNYENWHFKMLKVFISSILLILCNGCAVQKSEVQTPESTENKRKFNFGSIMDDGGIVIGDSRVAGKNNPAAQSINPYLWRASLDTFNFIPLMSADGMGGVIVTDWYSPDNLSSRLKFSVYIIGPSLRSDAIKIHAFKQIYRNNQWLDVVADEKLAFDLENIILTKARSLALSIQQSS